MFLRIFLFALTLLFLFLGNAKDLEGDTLTKEKYVRPRYTAIAAGFHSSQFRDFATSPLIYDGIGVAFSLGGYRLDEKVESMFDYQFTLGTFYQFVGNESAFASFNQSEWNYSYLRSLEALSSKKFNLKVGASINALLNIRNNENLYNNSNGLELINNLLFSSKATFDISRKSQKNWKFLFLNIKLKPKMRDISYRLNVGLINNYLRNGYSYLNQSWLLSNDSNFLSDYELGLFSGARLSSELNYTRYLPNGNAFRFTYTSNVYTTGEEIERKFEGSHHILKFVLMYRTK